MKIGIFGGTFNPVHNGHIMLAEYGIQQLGLDKLLIIPTFTPPHKLGKELVSSEHRLEMCRLAFENLKCAEISDIEIKRGGKSFSYQTVMQLKNIYPDAKLYFLMGADMFLTLDKWKNPQIIFENAAVAAVPRNGSDKSKLSEYYMKVIKPMGAKAVILERPVMQVSSTYIRAHIYSDASSSELLDKKVYDYIVRNNLYRM